MADGCSGRLISTLPSSVQESAWKLTCMYSQERKRKWVKAGKRESNLGGQLQELLGNSQQDVCTPNSSKAAGHSSGRCKFEWIAVYCWDGYCVWSVYGPGVLSATLRVCDINTVNCIWSPDDRKDWGWGNHQDNTWRWTVSHIWLFRKNQLEKEEAEAGRAKEYGRCCIWH